MSRAPSTARTIKALLRLRWQMVRRPRTRRLAAVGAGAVLGLLGAALVSGTQAGELLTAQVATVLAVMLLTFPVLAFLTGVAAGGGTEIVPSSQLVAYPISTNALFAGSVVLAPLNLPLAVQALLILGLSSYLAGPGPTAALGLAGGLGYVVAATLAGLALSWVFTGVRATWRGRRSTEAVGGALVALGVVLAAAGAVTTDGIADAFAVVVVGLLQPDATTRSLWVLGMAAVAAAGVLGGRRAAAWSAMRREDKHTNREARRHRRRPRRDSTFLTVLRVDLASIWRSRPVRRGILLLTVVPGLATLVSPQPWDALLLIPGLLATGAALLFGVNAFALDGGGALWLESTPRSHLLAFTAKAVATGLVVTGVVVAAVAMAALRPRGDLSATTVAAFVLCIAASVVWAVAIGARQSLVRPFRADLRDPRDTPAPPLVMTVHSARLIAVQLAIGVAYLIAARLAAPAGLALLTVLALTPAGLHLWGSARRWLEPSSRCLVVMKVAAG